MTFRLRPCRRLLPSANHEPFAASVIYSEPQNAGFEWEILREQVRGDLARAGRIGQRLGRPVMTALHTDRVSPNPLYVQPEILTCHGRPGRIPRIYERTRTTCRAEARRYYPGSVPHVVTLSPSLIILNVDGG